MKSNSYERLTECTKDLRNVSLKVLKNNLAAAFSFSFIEELLTLIWIRGLLT